MKKILLLLTAALLAGCTAQPARLPTLVPTLSLPMLAQAAPTLANAAPTASATMVPATATLTPVPPTPTVEIPLSQVDLDKGPDVLYTGKNTEMKLFWQGRAGQAYRVDWGVDGAFTNHLTASETDPERHLYTVALTGLTPGTRYDYRVVVNNQAAGGSFFAAPPDTAQALKFISYGDTRSHPDIHNAVAGNVMALTQADPAYQTLVILTGDPVADGSSEADWDAQFYSPALRNIRAELANLSMLPVMGNHEEGSPQIARYFPLPFVSAHYWSFDYGPAHFVMLDQYTDLAAGSAQYAWLESDLAGSAKLWKIVALHEPGWTAGGGHPNNAIVQNDLQPLFEKYGVELVLGGHLHYYARAEVNGVTHLTIGTGGAPLYQPEKNMPGVKAAFSTYGYTRFEIAGNRLTGQFVDLDGQMLDMFTIEK